jgi:hypothetical protein
MKTRKLIHYKPTKENQFAQNREWLRQQMRVYTSQLTHHQQLAKLHGDHAKLLFGLQRSGHKMVKPLLRQAKADAAHHQSMVMAHQQLIADVQKELASQKTAEHLHTKQIHTAPHKRKLTVRADTYLYKQGEVNNPASVGYYAGLGINMYNAIMQDLRNDDNFSTYINNSNDKKARRLAIKSMQDHPQYLAMQSNFDKARKLALQQSEERLGTITNRFPQGMYYDQREFGIPRTGI